MHLGNSGSRIDRSDEYLLELALQGHNDCFGELIQRWQQRIYSFICRYVGNAVEAQDLTQDTFTKAYKNLSGLSDPSRFSSWLYKIALNECRMRFRKQRKVQMVSWEDSQSYLSREKLQVDDATPEKQLATKERVLLLREAFGQLPEEQRVVIVMKEYQGLKFHEISEVLDVPLSTVKSRMYLGLKTLKKLMERKL